jgi:hypothetical protein
MLAGTIVRCDGGAVTPYNRQALALQPPPAAATQRSCSFVVTTVDDGKQAI